MKFYTSRVLRVLALSSLPAILALFIGITATPADASGLAQQAPQVAQFKHVFKWRNSQLAADCISDSGGGFIVACLDFPIVYGDYSPVYVQRLDAHGAKKWGAKGRLIAPHADYWSGVSLVPDALGGALVFWDQEGALYCQHVSTKGDKLFAGDGIKLLENGGRVCSDRTGGAFIASTSASSGPVLQHLSPDGNLSTTHTLPVAPNGFLPYVASMSEDGNGGVFVFSGNSAGVQGQHFSHDGNALWDEAGVSSAAGFDSSAPDGAGGLIAAWWAWTPGASLAQLFVQRITASGEPSWGATGVQLSQNSLISDPIVYVKPDGGAFVAWGERDDSFPIRWSNWLQSVDSSGHTQWAGRGLDASLFWNLLPAADGGADIIKLKDGFFLLDHLNSSGAFSTSPAALQLVRTNIEPFSLSGFFIQSELGNRILVWDEPTKKTADNVDALILRP